MPLAVHFYATSFRYITVVQRLWERIFRRTTVKQPEVRWLQRHMTMILWLQCTDENNRSLELSTIHWLKSMPLAKYVSGDLISYLTSCSKIPGTRLGIYFTAVTTKTFSPKPECVYRHCFFSINIRQLTIYINGFNYYYNRY